MNEKIERFNTMELFFFRIQLGILLFGSILLSLSYAFTSEIESIARVFVNIVYLLFYVTIFMFFLSIGRLIKYFIVFSKSEIKPTIWRNVTIMLTSPIAFLIYFILTLAMSLSLASCS